ncbi:LuxR C-terminal-related transcriptional regulator [Pseudomonas sp. 21LCFQ02]|uniref:LuxR C-terminal-related transcriptional regulator n=1 Tax=Pseudomonas sp. 21LCFQ02 TaxID=2957505 RepID=UPI00209AF710|nr:LuxR C-terminal-related transcriptional regulator [Pseudomonas sp. 21LCFQ02]MCO8168187.1 LuxR C-terminal-related transcriptional regulator [Pseudomonas sp. 21LCFQ02]
MTDLSRMQGFVDHATHTLERRFFRPPLSEDHVPRPRLCERLRQGLSGRLILVGAPAGFGKSSLAVEFCESLPAPWQSAWLGLGRRDAEPGRFMERLLCALQGFFPQLGGQPLASLRLRNAQEPQALEAWLDALLDELAMHLVLSRPLLLVLDDYHLVQGPVLDRCLQMLLDHLPGGLVLLVTSRLRPDWQLSRLRLARHILELNEQDLRLTCGEAQALLARHALVADGPARQRLIERNEGWVAGLRFWLLATQGHAAQDSEALVSEYLLEEVIDYLPEQVQAFLYDTACLERFCSGLCDALRDRDDSAAMLDYLQLHQVFLIPLDEQGQWLRYHHLFADFLRSRRPEAATRLHLNACRWFHEHGMLDEAVEQALLAGDADTAASLAQHLAEEKLLAEQNVVMLLRWKMDLPDSLLASTPRLIVLYAWALGLACQPDAAEELASHLARFLPAPSATAQQSMLAQWLALSGIIARGRGDADTARRYCSEALLSLPERRYGQRLVCLSTLVNLAITDGDLLRARALSRDALELAQRLANPLFEALACHDRAQVLQARGEIFRALEQVRTGLQLLNKLDPARRYPIRARLTLYHGYLLSLCLRTDEAFETLRSGLAEARDCRDISVLTGYCTLASLLGRARRQAEAFAELAEVERLMHGWGVPPVHYLAMITLVKCELWQGQGRIGLAGPWLLRLSQTYSAGLSLAAPECQPQLPLQVELQRAELANGETALSALQALEQRAADIDAQWLVLNTLTRRMAVLLDQGRQECATPLLARSLAISERGGLLAFQPLIERHAAWLRQQLHKVAVSEVRDTLLEHLPGGDNPQCATLSGESLSARELGVLQLIAQGFSNQQISERLFISLHTVKSHASHINGKLGVERRTQAVARAKALGLLS